MIASLQGKRVAILVEDGFEDPRVDRPARSIAWGRRTVTLWSADGRRRIQGQARAGHRES